MPSAPATTKPPAAPAQRFRNCYISVNGDYICDNYKAARPARLATPPTVRPPVVRNYSIPAPFEALLALNHMVHKRLGAGHHPYEL
jgi:hypothetical protein